MIEWFNDLLVWRDTNTNRQSMEHGQGRWCFRITYKKPRVQRLVGSTGEPWWTCLHRTEMLPASQHLTERLLNAEELYCISKETGMKKLKLTCINVILDISICLGKESHHKFWMIKNDKTLKDLVCWVFFRRQIGCTKMDCVVWLREPI